MKLRLGARAACAKTARRVMVHTAGCFFVPGGLEKEEEDLGQSTRWKTWSTILDLRTCARCRERNGKVYEMNGFIEEGPPLHDRCRCSIIFMKTIPAGQATDKGKDGADYYLIYYRKLPDYYISKAEAEALGWRRKRGNLHLVAPGKMIGGDRYLNDDGKLPDALGRRWYEADINYTAGRRNTQRIVYSNDGLVFVTYDHYGTFQEIIRGGGRYGIRIL